MFVFLFRNIYMLPRLQSFGLFGLVLDHWCVCVCVCVCAFVIELHRNRNSPPSPSVQQKFFSPLLVTDVNPHLMNVYQ